MHPLPLDVGQTPPKRAQMLKPRACDAMTITGDRFFGPRNESREGTGLCWLHFRRRGLLGKKKKRETRQLELSTETVLGPVPAPMPRHSGVQFGFSKLLPSKSFALYESTRTEK